MLCPCMGENEIHTRTMVLFDLLKEYRWDAKAVLVLGALAATYGGLLLPIHLGSNDPVAASIATLNQLPMERTTFRPWLNPLSLLIKVLVDVTKCITEFERLPFKQAKVDSNLVGETMSKIRLATYWVVKSALACLQQIPYFKQPQQVHFLPFFCFKQPQQVNSLKYSGNRIKESCRGTFQFGISVAQHAYPSQQASRRMQYTDR